MGPKGRKALVDNWSQYLPMYSTQEPIAPQQQNQSPPSGSPPPNNEPMEPEDDEDEEIPEGVYLISQFLLDNKDKNLISLKNVVYFHRINLVKKTV